jgi:biotin carboxylase
MKRILVVFPTAWDRRHLARLASRYEVVLAAPTDEDCPADFGILGWVDATGNGFDGVFSSSDYPGAVAAAAIASARGLPGSAPEAVLRCSHKYAARLVHADVAPEATPSFALVDPERLDAPLHWVHPAGGRRAEAPFPCFLKPVKGAFSVLSRRVDSEGELRAFLDRACVRDYTCDYLRLFDRLLERYGGGLPVARHFIAESILGGDQVTVEGYVAGDEIGFLGVVDSVLQPGTRSFARFEYPSRLPHSVQERMRDVARRIVRGVGLRDTLFNVEMTWDPATDRLGVIEVNPRMCGQFADLYAQVDGTHGYEVALAVAAGERPAIRHGAGSARCAASFPLRVFEPVRVRRAPSPEDQRAAEALYPGTLVWVECEAGSALRDFDSGEDGSSARYAVVNLGAPDRESLAHRFEAVRTRLGFELEALRPAAAGAASPAAT